jgi:chromatin modification-related protein EAF6
MPDTTAPASSTPGKPAVATPSATREQAVAYYEKVRKQLRDMLYQKRHHDKQLVGSCFSALDAVLKYLHDLQALYEDNIFKAETAYLEETQNGNIIKGFDNYIKGGVARRKTNFSDSDRIFSLSSLTYAARVCVCVFFLVRGEVN